MRFSPAMAADALRGSAPGHRLDRLSVYYIFSVVSTVVSLSPLSPACSKGSVAPLRSYIPSLTRVLESPVDFEYLFLFAEPRLHADVNSLNAAPTVVSSLASPRLHTSRWLASTTTPGAHLPTLNRRPSQAAGQRPLTACCQPQPHPPNKTALV